MKIYSLIAIVGLIFFIVGGFLYNETIGLLGIALIFLSIPFNINDNLKIK